MLKMDGEGEILLKEKYGSSAREVLYVKPPGQTTVVVIQQGRPKDWFDWLAAIFLPYGYPESVSKDYAAYQLWDTAQAFCSTITGTLATQEVLRGVGVGSTAATPLAATVTWVIKDGCGHLGRILFAFTHGTELDAYSKKWRLYADTLNDAAMCIEIALPLFKSCTIFALCISTTMKAIVGVAGGASRAALTQHHAVRGNLADVAAKDSAQETAVNLLASFTALFLITYCGSSLGLFFLLMVLHIVFNYLAVRAVCLRTLNEPRYLQVIETYLKRETISAPCIVNKQEPILFSLQHSKVFDARLSGFRIILGRSLNKITKKRPRCKLLANITHTYASRNYILYPVVGTKEMYVLFREGATTVDILLAYFHAVILSTIIGFLNNEPLFVDGHEITANPFAQVCLTLAAAEWSREPIDEVGPSGYRFEPTVELTQYVDDVVRKEWPRIKAGLAHTGWDLSKHLLLVDEWRIAGDAKDESYTNRVHANDNDPVVIKESMSNKE